MSGLARLRATQARAEVEILDLCAEQQDQLAAAKAAHEENPTAKTLAAKKKAMDEMHQFRAWLRSASETSAPQPVRPAGRTRRGGA